jgi:5-methylcytosine-specific restriction endonuclease McrA
LMAVTLQSNPKMIVYIEEFDRRDSIGNLLCRNISCKNYPRPPFRKYCSKKCNKDFRRWYFHNFYWERVRSDIFRRDKYTCQVCKRKYPFTYRKRFVRSRKLECDHIIPRSLYEQNGFKFDTLENKIKTTIGFLHNHENLRTLCSDCHRNETSRFLRVKSKSRTSD